MLYGSRFGLRDISKDPPTPWGQRAFDLREFACETHVILAPGAFALGSKQAEMHHFGWKSIHKYTSVYISMHSALNSISLYLLRRRE